MHVLTSRYSFLTVLATKKPKVKSVRVYVLTSTWLLLHCLCIDTSLEPVIREKEHYWLHIKALRPLEDSLGPDLSLMTSKTSHLLGDQHMDMTDFRRQTSAYDKNSTQGCLPEGFRAGVPTPSLHCGEGVLETDPGLACDPGIQFHKVLWWPWASG